MISAQVQDNSITRKHCPSGNGFPSCWTQSACSYPSTNLNVILVVKPRKNTLPGNLPPSLPETNPPECYTSGQTKEEYPAWKSSIILSETFPQHKPFISKKSINFFFIRNESFLANAEWKRYLPQYTSLELQTRAPRQRK